MKCVSLVLSGLLLVALSGCGGSGDSAKLRVDLAVAEEELAATKEQVEKAEDKAQKEAEARETTQEELAAQKKRAKEAEDRANKEAEDRETAQEELAAQKKRAKEAEDRANKEAEDRETAQEEAQQAQEEAQRARQEAQRAQQRAEANTRGNRLLMALQGLHDDASWAGDPSGAAIPSATISGSALKLESGSYTGRTSASPAGFHSATLTHTVPGSDERRKVVAYTDRELTRTFENHFGKHIDDRNAAKLLFDASSSAGRWADGNLLAGRGSHQRIRSRLRRHKGR